MHEWSYRLYRTFFGAFRTIIAGVFFWRGALGGAVEGIGEESSAGQEGESRIRVNQEGF